MEIIRGGWGRWAHRPGMPFFPGRRRVPVYRSEGLSSMEAGRRSEERFGAKKGAFRATRYFAWGCFRDFLAAAGHLGNPGGVAAAHQDAVLGATELGDADGEPDADRGQRDCERKGCDIGEHAVTEVVGLVARPFVTREVVGFRPGIVGLRPGSGPGGLVVPVRRMGR